jgi:hypothetical protein
MKRRGRRNSHGSDCRSDDAQNGQRPPSISPIRPDQPEVQHGGHDLGPRALLEVPQQLEPPGVVPLCWMHHRAYDTGRLGLVPYLEPEWRLEAAHAVLHLGLAGELRRLGRPGD